MVRRPDPLVSGNPPTVEDVRRVARIREPVLRARDWSVLEQWMHYIVHLFRAMHEDARLSGPPFAPDQVRSILAGRIPEGSLG